ncbi:hypothetical protein [Pigmentiphaga litoralis]|uniref:DsrE family protein n=1 Tax=Pigmentiphaga litoralis TaxID=516702 RepID=UPI003899C43F
MTPENKGDAMKVVLHAPTATALTRARSNLNNLIAADPTVRVAIVINADAVAAALDNPNPVSDSKTLVCPNTLKKINRTAAEPLKVLEEGAIVALVKMQSDGWTYIRA